MYATVDYGHKLVVFWSERAGSMTVLHYMSQLMDISSMSLRIQSMGRTPSIDRHSQVKRLDDGRLEISYNPAQTIISIDDIDYTDEWSSIVIYRDPIKRAVSSFIVGVTKPDITFADFINNFEEHTNTHCALQTYLKPYEKVLKQAGRFSKVINIENMKEFRDFIFEKYSVSLSDVHLNNSRKNNNTMSSYYDDISTVPKRDIKKHAIPSFEKFYTPELLELAMEKFKDDLDFIAKYAN